MAQSDTFAQLIKDIAGSDGVRGFARRSGLSTSYSALLFGGSVPSDEVLGRIAATYGLDADMSRKLFDAAKETRSDINPESLIQVACAAEGFDTAARLQVLECFRALRAAKTDQQSAA